MHTGCLQLGQQILPLSSGRGAGGGEGEGAAQYLSGFEKGAGALGLPWQHDNPNMPLMPPD